MILAVVYPQTIMKLMCYSYTLQLEMGSSRLDKNVIVCNPKGEASSVASSGRPCETMHLSVVDGPLLMTCIMEWHIVKWRRRKRVG